MWRGIDTVPMMTGVMRVCPMMKNGQIAMSGPVVIKWAVCLTARNKPMRGRS
jgi:hypothetical protein